MTPHSIDSSRKKGAIAVTSGAGNDQLLYFTSSSVTAQDRQLVFISDRTGHPNLFALGLASGLERQLTHNVDGYLKSYVYFDGRPYTGFGKASVSLDVHRGIAYYIQGRDICSVTLEGEQRVLAQYPKEQMTAYMHVSADGKRLCVPTVDARAMDGDKILVGKPDYDIDLRVREEHLASYLRVYDTASGEEIDCIRVAGAWVTHVQFSPIDPQLILYNNEWPSDCGIRRMWLWDGEEHRAVRSENQDQSRTDWVCHEMWDRDGSAILYHGATPRGRSFVGRATTRGDCIEILLPEGWERYGHFTCGPNRQLVSDGYYDEMEHTESTGNMFGEWISVLNVDWAGRRIKWVPLCRSESSWRTQDAHPHPIFNQAGDRIFFTSDKEGRRRVYALDPD